MTREFASRTPLKADAVFDALSNPVRRKIVTALARAGMKAAAELNPGGLSRAAVLKHLSVLYDAGVVEKKTNASDVCTFPETLVTASAC